MQRAVYLPLPEQENRGSAAGCRRQPGTATAAGSSQLLQAAAGMGSTTALRLQLQIGGIGLPGPGLVAGMEAGIAEGARAVCGGKRMKAE